MSLEIPGFKIQEKISEDTSSEVWQGYQLSLQRVVEIKVLKTEVAGDTNEVNRFITDARSAAKIKHPNVTQVFDVNDHEGIYYAAQESIDGDSLNDIILNSGRMSWKKVLDIMQYVVDALDHAMETASITHRYLTPSCILLDTEGIVKIRDLGMAKPIDGTRLLEQMRKEEVTEGVNYVAPEQVQGSSIVSSQADMYSIGAIMYHLLTGQEPFKNRTLVETAEQHVVGFLANPKTIVPSIPPATVNLITRLMMKNPGKRFLGWDKARKAIKQAMVGRFQQDKVAPFTSTIAPSAIRPAPTATPANQPTPEKPVPAIAHVGLFALVAGVWALMASHLLPSTPNSDTTTHDTTPATQPAPTPDQVPRATPPPPAPPPQSNDPTQQQATQAPEPDSPPASTPPAEPSGPTIPDSFFLLRLNIAEQMISEQYANAAFSLAEEIDKEPPPHVLTAMQSLQTHILALSQINKVIAGRFENRLQARVTIRYRNSNREVKVVGVEDDKVIVEVEQKIGEASVTQRTSFGAGTLEDKERLHWLGATSSPQECGMKFILYWKTGRYEEAKLIAPQCGDLANEFYQLAEAKLQEANGNTF